MLLLVTFNDSVVPAGQNKFVITPIVDGGPVDLSDPKNAGKKVGWRCGDGVTTVPTKFLRNSHQILTRNVPLNCR